VGSAWKILEDSSSHCPFPCGVSPNVTDSKAKRNQGQSDFFEAKDLVDQKK